MKLLQVIALGLTIMFSESVCANNVSQDDINDTQVQSILLSQDIAAMQKLIDAGLDINSLDENGYPMITYTLINNADLKMFRFLVEAGADTNVPATNGLTPLLLAVAIAPEIQKQTIDTTQSLPNGDIEREIELARQSQQTKFQLNRAEEILKILIEAGADVNQETPYGTPLMKACSSDWNYNMVNALIKAGAKVNQKDNNGRTALFYAEAFKAVNVSSLLIKSGADIMVKDNYGKDYLNVLSSELFDE